MNITHTDTGFCYCTACDRENIYSAFRVASDVENFGYWRHPDPAIGVMRPHSVSISTFLLFAFFVFAVSLGAVGIQMTQRDMAEDQLRTVLSGAAARQSQADMTSATLQQQVAKESACEIRTLNYRKAVIEANDAAQAHARTDPYAASVGRVLSHLKAMLN